MSYLTEKIHKTIEEAVTLNMPEQLRQKEANATDEEKKQIAHIRKKLNQYMANGNIEGAQEYLKNLKQSLT